MTNDEAKFVLNAYRSNGADAADPTFGPALEQAQRDPALGAWLQWQQNFDRAMTKKLGEIDPPEGLREAILAGAKLSQPEKASRAWWNRSTLLAIAASMTVLLAVTAGLLWPKNATAGTNLTDFALADARSGHSHGGHESGQKEIRAILSQTDLRLCEGLRVDFVSLKESGCRTVKFEGRDVLEVCFKRNGAWFQCYIALRKDFPEYYATSTPTIFARENGAVAAWVDATQIYLVASKGDCVGLQKLL